ncbi:MAG: 5'-nucleotidase C-terminal domain-containing protein [Firmicutes bacterium]|nr:5'-nucleotidase C-terminal domain-containing protein [Bacillota bacterium]
MSRKILSLVLVLSMVFGMSTFAMDAGMSTEKEIIVVHTNDTHARLEEGKYAGMGFDKIATYVRDLRAQGKNVLLLDAGDTFHGQTIATISKGASVAQVLNRMEYDALVAGNHDFNYGQDRLVELNKLTTFPILTSNVKKADGTTLVEDYVIKEVDGVKIGIFGICTPETTYMTHPKNVEGLTFEDPIESARMHVKMLQDMDVDMIIALTHVGLDESSKVVSSQIAEQVDGIDLMVDGHSHTTLKDGLKVNDTLIVQTGEYDKNLGIVKIKLMDNKVKDMSAMLLSKEEGAALDSDPEIEILFGKLKAANDKITSVIVAETPIKLDGERQDVRTGETNLGNLIADAMINESGADIAFTNGGGIRASIEAGQISKGDVITVLPFGNYIVTKNVKGSDIKAAIEHGVMDYPATKGAFPHVAGIKVTYDPARPVGDKVTSIMYKGMPLEMDKAYNFVTNDFLAAGGDGYEMFDKYPIAGEFKGLDEALIDYIPMADFSMVKVEGRIMRAGQDMMGMMGKMYKVKKGDMLWKIAKENGVMLEDIIKMNNLKNPNLIVPGQEIKLP